MISWYGRLSANKEIMLTKKWYEKVRHSHVGQMIVERLQDQPELLKEFRQLFKQQNDKLSYYDLFQFLNNQLDIQMENWEEEALENRLDRLGLAFIEFNEFNEFTHDYGLDWGEPVWETDIEQIVEAEMNLSYKDYQVTADDFFMGCPTMLTSEKAALAQVREIYKDVNMNQNTRFVDSDFGPKNSGDIEGSARSLYKSGKPQ